MNDKHGDRPEDILNFWFSTTVKPLWFKKSSKFDQEIKQRFHKIYQQAAAGSLNSWRNQPGDTLALIIILDQFARNMFRNTPQAFATDPQALELTKYALEHNYQQKLSLDQQAFLYMPLMHSEKKEDQADCVELFSQLGTENYLEFALKHQTIIDRFGRFPHRNQILGRKSTPAETSFLTQPGSSF
jgi:uncharacterized protein (DUF924 family)